MGMSSRVEGVRDLDGKFAAMMKVKLACEEAGCDYPEDVRKYFANNLDYLTAADGKDRLKRAMEQIDISTAVHAIGWDSTEGYEVILSELPDEVKKIRFLNSW